jgi:hypothetical protein
LAVDFNNQLGFGTEKVGDVWIDCHLTAKAKPGELLSA